MAKTKGSIQENSDAQGGTIQRSLEDKMPMIGQMKNELRKKMQSQRNSMGAVEVEFLSTVISDKLVMNERFLEAKTVGFYLPKGNEVDTSKMIGHAFRMGKEVLAPVTDHEIAFYKLSSLTELKTGKYGIPEPKSRVAPNKEPDVIVVPGISFGLCMHRLGYGKGYYDKFLSSSAAYRIGICFDFQVVDRLPSHINDERMDMIITEKRVIL